MGFPADIPVRFDANRTKPGGETSSVIHKWLNDFWNKQGGVATIQDFLDSLPRDYRSSSYAELPAAKKGTRSFKDDPRRFVAGYVTGNPFGSWEERGRRIGSSYFVPVSDPMPSR